MTDRKHDDAHAEHSENDEATTKAAKEPTAKAAPREATPQPFPYSASINEPQTISIPIPPDIEVPVPVIESLNPASCMVGDPDFPLIVSGDNFFGDSVINFAGQDEPTTYDADARTLSTIVKPSLWADPVIVPVIIKNGPAQSGPIDFEFAAPASRAKKGK